MKKLAVGWMILALAHVCWSQIIEARQAEARGDFAAAERVYAAAVKTSPTPELWNRLGLVRHLQNKFDAASEAFAEALRMDKGLWQARIVWAIDLYRTNRFAESLEQLGIASKNAAADGPARDEIDYWTAAGLIATGKRVAGLASLERLLGRNPGHREGLELATQTYADAADTLWNQVAEKAFESRAGQVIHAHALEGEGNVDEALKRYLQAGALRDAGRLKMARGQVREAALDLEKAAMDNPSDAEANFLAGLCAVQLSDWGRAAPYLEKAVGWWKLDAEPAIALAQVYLALHRPADAAVAAKKALEITPGSVVAKELLEAAR